MPVKLLPPNPSLDHLKHQAKDLLKAHPGRDPGAAQRLRAFHPRFLNTAGADIFTAAPKLSDAQLAIARESGFLSWSRLKSHIEMPEPSDQIDLPRHERIKDLVFRRAMGPQTRRTKRHNHPPAASLAVLRSGLARYALKLLNYGLAGMSSQTNCQGDGRDVCREIECVCCCVIAAHGRRGVPHVVGSGTLPLLEYKDDGCWLDATEVFFPEGPPRQRLLAI